VVLNEGKNREIRRMLARLGHKVMRLKRIALGPVPLSRLPAGKARRLSPDEVAELRRAAQRGQRQEGQGGDPAGQARSSSLAGGRPSRKEGHRGRPSGKERERYPEKTAGKKRTPRLPGLLDSKRKGNGHSGPAKSKRARKHP